MKTILKVALGILLAATVLIVGCVALLGTAANEVDKQLTTEQNTNAITLRQYRDVAIGTRKDQVVEELGEPADRQEFESEGFLQDEPQSSSCVYYNRRGGDVGQVFQFCFDGNKLTSKNAF